MEQGPWGDSSEGDRLGAPEQACTGTPSRESNREVPKPGLRRCGHRMMVFLRACPVGEPFQTQNKTAHLRQSAVRVPCEPDSMTHHGPCGLPTIFSPEPNMMSRT